MEPGHQYSRSRQGLTTNRVIESVVADEEERSRIIAYEELRWLRRKYNIVCEFFETVMDREDVRMAFMKEALPHIRRFYEEDEENLADELIDDLCLFYDSEMPFSEREIKIMRMDRIIEQFDDEDAGKEETENDGSVPF